MPIWRMAQSLRQLPIPPPVDGLPTIGKRLRAIRKIAGMKQAEMAEICGAEQSVWSKWEAGTRQPDVFAIMRFCRRAQISLDLIFFGLPKDSHPSLVESLREQFPELLTPERSDPDPRKDSQAAYRTAIRLVSSNS